MFFIFVPDENIPIVIYHDEDRDDDHNNIKAIIMMIRPITNVGGETMFVTPKSTHKNTNINFAGRQKLRRYKLVPLHVTGDT